jgi:predicted transcriptional regulator
MSSSSLTTFRFDEKMTKTIEELKAATNSSSKADIVKRAIALYQVIQEAQQRGDRVLIRSTNAAEGQPTDTELKFL